MDFAVGDYVVINDSARGRYGYTVPGVFGTILDNRGHEYLIHFEYDPYTNPMYTYGHSESFLIEKRFVSPATKQQQLSLEERICAKVRKLDADWLAKQKQKGVPYAIPSR